MCTCFPTIFSKAIVSICVDHVTVSNLLVTVCSLVGRGVAQVRGMPERAGGGVARRRGLPESGRAGAQTHRYEYVKAPSALDPTRKTLLLQKGFFASQFASLLASGLGCSVDVESVEICPFNSGRVPIRDRWIISLVAVFAAARVTLSALQQQLGRHEEALEALQQDDAETDEQEGPALVRIARSSSAETLWVLRSP